MDKLDGVERAHGLLRLWTHVHGVYDMCIWMDNL